VTQRQSLTRTNNPRTSEQIKAEIEGDFGFFPPFFAPALGSPQVLENLWRQTLSAYMDNPLSALFKERLNALLSRFCAAPYCMIVHSAALRPLGMTAGQVLMLLDPPPSTGGVDGPQDNPALGVLPAPAPEEAAAPAPDSPLERTLLACAMGVFLERADAPECQAELRRLLGSDLYPNIIAYLAYIKTCHTWVEAHPEIACEADQRAMEHLGPLLAEEPALVEFFRHYQERVAVIQAGRVTQAAVAAERARADQAIRESEEKLRLLVDGAKDYAMILMDPEGRITSWNAGAERITGWAEAEMLGRPVDLIFTPEDREAGVPTREIARVGAEGRSPDLRWHLRKDGSRFFGDGLTERLSDAVGNPRGFAKIMRDATAQEQAEQERGRADEELRAAHERTANILESITDGFYAVDRDWNFTYVNPQAERIISRKREEVLGKNLWAEFPDASDFLFGQQYRRAMSEGVPISVEEFYPPLGIWLEVRAYPSPESLSVFFQDVSERKALELERERLAEREHRIAEQLQSALQPELPGVVPGLAVTKYYEVALATSEGVGGDFYDVFSIEEGCTALVVGDLSGKGLQAAASVSIVRNMLRAFLYTQPTVAEAVIELNRVLAENNLLSGFTTLFVGAYDRGTRRLKYANCGQEPALLKRSATGAVEQLPPTGPILGSIENAQYTEETVVLAPGDALAIFSDGLTEVGPSRTDMLGIEGVTALLAEPAVAGQAQGAPGMAEHLLLRLIQGVDAAAAGGVMRDDVCLLVSVVEG